MHKGIIQMHVYVLLGFIGIKITTHKIGDNTFWDMKNVAWEYIF